MGMAGRGRERTWKVKLSLTRDEVARLEAAALRSDLQVAAMCRRLLLAGMRREEQQVEARRRVLLHQALAD